MGGVITWDGDRWTWVFTTGPSRLGVNLSGSLRRWRWRRRPQPKSGPLNRSLLGLRVEEVGGLRWLEVDLETGALRIRQARVVGKLG
jgi:hypothetical protein